VIFELKKSDQIEFIIYVQNSFLLLLTLFGLKILTKIYSLATALEGRKFSTEERYKKRKMEWIQKMLEEFTSSSIKTF
jgi:hypothetical protein